MPKTQGAADVLPTNMSNTLATTDSHAGRSGWACKSLVAAWVAQISVDALSAIFECDKHAHTYHVSKHAWYVKAVRPPVPT